MKFRTISIFALIVLISGCIGQSGNGTVPTGQFVGGEQGLEVEFVQLPTKVLQSDSFDINLVASNRGETAVPVDAVQFQLSNSQAFGLAGQDVKKNTEPLPKVVETGGFGGQTFVSFEGANYVGGVLSEESPVPISVEACYPYSTSTAFDLCIARSEFNDVCSTREFKEVYNSGAPVHITDVEQVLSLLTGDKVRVALILTVKKLGEPNDRIYSRRFEGSGGGTTCGEKAANSENEVFIEEVRIGNLLISNVNPNAGTTVTQKLEDACGSNFIRLNPEGEGKIQCNLEISGYTPARGDYVERTTVKLGYLHDTVASTSIQIIPLEVG